MVSLSKVINSWVLFTTDGMLESVGFRKRSRYANIFSVGPLMPLTMGQMPCGVLWILVKK